MYLACKEAMDYRVLDQDGHERLPGMPLDAEMKAKVYNKMRELDLIG